MFLPDTLDLLEADQHGDQTVTFVGRFRVKSKILNFESGSDIFITDTNWLIDGNKLYTNYFAHFVLQKE